MTQREESESPLRLVAVSVDHALPGESTTWQLVERTWSDVLGKLAILLEERGAVLDPSPAVPPITIRVEVR